MCGAMRAVLCKNVPMHSEHIRDWSYAERDHYTQLNGCSPVQVCRNTGYEGQDRSTSRSPFTEWCWAEPFPHIVWKWLSVLCVCVRWKWKIRITALSAASARGSNGSEHNTEKLVKWSKHVLTMEHHTTAIHWFMHQLSLSAPQPPPILHPHPTHE